MNQALPQSARSNARWIALIQLSRIGVQLLSLLLLSRLLSPRDFGLVALAAVVTNFAMLLRDLGTASALIQKPQLDERTIATAFWIGSGMGLLLGVAVAAGAPLLAALMRAPEVGGLLLVLAVAFPISGSTTMHQALLERQGRFATVARIEISSVLAGFAVAVIAALAGAGAYSLVLQTVAVALLSSAQFWFRVPWRPRWLWDRATSTQLWKFGGHLSAFNIVNYISRNADSLIIGRVLGAAALGPYSLAYRIMLFPLYNLTFVASRALFPVMSRQQHDLPQLARLYLRALSVIAFFAAPLMMGLWVLREPFVAVVLGPRWTTVTALIAWLAPAGLIQSLSSPSGSVLMALGHTRLQLKLGLVGMLAQLTAFAIGVRWGVVGVAQCYLLASILQAVMTIIIVQRLLNAPAAALRAVARPLLIALAMAAIMHAALITLQHRAALPLLQLALAGAAGVVFYLLAAHLGARVIEQDARRMLVLRTSGTTP